MKTAVVFFADGFEECEGLLVVDLLRRAKINVITASVMGRKEILSSHRISLQADALAEEVDFSLADMVILPGGIPGTNHLAASETVKAQCLAFAEKKKLSAICAAPSVLAALGLLKGKEATCYPSFEEKMAGAVMSGKDVSVAGNIITGRALGAAIPFALELIRQLEGEETAQHVADTICYNK